MTAGRPRLLMCVYNPIDYDGRVQRSATRLAADFDVTVLAVAAGGSYAHPAFRIETVELPADGSKYLAHVRFARAVWRAALRDRPSVVYAHDYFMAASCWAAARRIGARFVYDAHELVIPAPGERLPAREAIWYRLERAVVHRADLVIAANAERAGLMRDHYGLRATPTVVRNITAPAPGALTDAAVLAAYPAIRRRRDDEVLVAYQGDMSLSRGIGVFLEAARRLPDDVRLVLVGGGPDHGAIAARIADPSLADRVTQVGRVPRDHLHDILRCCDVGLISYDTRGLNNIYCAPNKLYEYAQSGLPMVTTSQPPLRDALERYGIGEVVPTTGDAHADAAAWASAIGRVSDALERYRSRLPAFLADHEWTADHDHLRAAIARPTAAAASAPTVDVGRA